VVSVSSSHYVLILMKQQSQVETLDLSALYQPLQHSTPHEVRAATAVKHRAARNRIVPPRRLRVRVEVQGNLPHPTRSPMIVAPKIKKEDDETEVMAEEDIPSLHPIIILLQLYQ